MTSVIIFGFTLAAAFIVEMRHHPSLGFWR